MNNIGIWERIWLDRSEGEGCKKLSKFPDEILIRIFESKRFFNFNSGDRLLEIGFGAGNDSLYFVKKGFNVEGVEIVQSSLDNATKLFQKAGYKFNAKLFDGQKLEYENDTFDFIVNWYTLHYNTTFKRVKNIIEEMLRVLKPGGYLILSTVTLGHTMLNGAEKIDNNSYRVSNKFASDARGGAATLYVCNSIDEFASLFSKFKGRKTGHVHLDLFDPTNIDDGYLLLAEK